MFALSILPAVCQCVGMALLPESPRYLLLKNQELEVNACFKYVADILLRHCTFMVFNTGLLHKLCILLLNLHGCVQQARRILETLLDGGRLEVEIDSMKSAIQEEQVRSIL